MRITDSKKGRVAYVVSLFLDRVWGATEREALWIESEVSGVSRS